MSANQDSDLKKLKVLRKENDANSTVAYLHIILLGEKVNHLREICKESPVGILFVGGTKTDSSYPDSKFQINNYQFSPFRRDRNKYGGGKIVFIRQALSQEGYRSLKQKCLIQYVLS